MLPVNPDPSAYITVPTAVAEVLLDVNVPGKIFWLLRSIHFEGSFRIARPGSKRIWSGRAVGRWATWSTDFNFVPVATLKKHANQQADRRLHLVRQ